jgi:hypothetical protein
MFEKLVTLYLIGILFAFGVSVPIMHNQVPERSIATRFLYCASFSIASWFTVGAVIGEIWVKLQDQDGDK